MFNTIDRCIRGFKKINSGPESKASVSIHVTVVTSVVLGMKLACSPKDLPIAS